MVRNRRLREEQYGARRERDWTETLQREMVLFRYC
jgi:hypothetical protein